MNFWTAIQATFNNREIALLLWIAIIVLAASLSKLRKTLVSIIHTLLNRFFLILFSLIGSYLYWIIILLKEIGIWQSINLKDVLFWLFSVGLKLVFKIQDARDYGYFKDIFFSAIKWTLVLEFVANLYSFSLFTEIIILPVLFFLGTTQAIAASNEKHVIVSDLFRKIIALAGISIFSYSLYKTIVNFDDVLVFQNLVLFLQPSTITILFIPFLYFLALFCTYESFFTFLDNIIIDKEKANKLKDLTFRMANVNLGKLSTIKRNFKKGALNVDTDLEKHVYEISK